MYSKTTCGSWNFVQQDKTSNFTFFQWNEFGPSAGLTAGLGSVRVNSWVDIENVIIMIKADMSGFVATVALGTCEQ